MSEDDEDNPPTADDYKAEFLESVFASVQHWKNDNDRNGFGTCPFEGLAFSILHLLSGSINAGPFKLRPVDPETGNELEPINKDLHGEFCEMIREKNPQPRGTITMEFSDVKIVRNGE